MRIIRTINEYKVLIYALIVLAIYYMKQIGLIETATEVLLLSSATIVIVYSLGLLIQFGWKIIVKRSKFESILEELRHDLSRGRKKAVVVIRNAPFSNLALRNQYTTAVQEKDWWDWSYVGLHPDCDKFCDELFKELKTVYIDSPDPSRIRTSSLTFLKEYPLKPRRKTLVFMGDIVVPKGSEGPSHFPAHIWDAMSEVGYEPDFYKLYIIETSWRADKKNCIMSKSKTKIERDPSKVKEEWNRVSQSVMQKAATSETLVYKHQPAQTKDERLNFFTNLEKNVSKICKSSLFVISPSSGSAFSVAREGFSGHFWAKFFLIVGWCISPISFYNDFIVNLPLTLVIAYPFIRFWRCNKLLATGVAYTFTNILGFVFIYVGLHIAKKVPKRRLSITRTSIIFAFYLTAIAIIGKLFFEIDWRSILASVSRLF